MGLQEHHFNYNEVNKNLEDCTWGGLSVTALVVSAASVLHWPFDKHTTVQVTTAATSEVTQIQTN